MRTMTLAAVLLVLSIPSFAESRSSHAIALNLETIRQIELGQPLPVTVTFRNTSDRPVRLVGDVAVDGFPVHLRVTIENARCRMTIIPLRSGARPKESSMATLQPGGTLRLDLPPLNINVLYHDIWNYAGPAWLQVEYVVSAEDATAGAWYGAVGSDLRSVTFLPPSEEEVARQRNKLQECVTTGAFSCHEIIGYFAAVTDSAAADLLITLLGKHPHLYVAAKSIVAQARPADAASLEVLAHRPLADSDYLLAAAKALRRQEAAGCRESVIRSETAARQIHLKE